MTNTSRVTALMLFLVSMFPIASYAECAEDRLGDVYCSVHPSGGVVVDRFGNPQCGKGQCRQDNSGSVYCSKIPDGGAEINRFGMVMCFGGCEQASTNMCALGER